MPSFTFISGWVDVLWVERSGTPTARFRLSTTRTVVDEHVQMGDSQITAARINDVAPDEDPYYEGNTFIIRLDQDLASAFVMVAMIQEAVVSRLSVAVSFEPGTGAYAGDPMVTGVRIVGPGGAFDDEFNG